MPQPESKARVFSGLTPRSVAAALVVILISGVVTELAGVLDDANPLIGTEALPVPALLVFLPLLAASAGVFGLARARVLSKPELVCVLIAALVATPLMGIGFWRYQVAGLGTVMRTADWRKLDALPEGLWPHGENLLRGVLRGSGVGLCQGRGGSARLENGRALLSSLHAEAMACVRIRVRLAPEPVASSSGASPAAVPGRPYVFTALVRAKNLGPGASYFVRLYADADAEHSAEPITGRSEAKPKPMLPDGAERVGAYPLALPSEARGSVVFELGLKGAGEVEWRDPSLYDVRALQFAYNGVKRVTGSEYARLSLAERQGVVVVPDSPFSVAGLRYLAGLVYPLEDWIPPIARLGAFALLAFAASFGLSLLYRKQWLENERYPLPMGRVLLVLLGADARDGGLGPSFLRNRWLLLGFFASFTWCALKVLYGYVPSLPDLRIAIPLKSYLADAFWGNTWSSVEFQVLALFFGLALLLELNVLLSLVVGFFAFRLQYWFGQAHGLAADTDFPYFPYQMLGAYLAYVLLLVIFTRRYLGRTLRAALGPGAQGEALTQRAGIVLVLASTAGFVGWTAWIGVPFLGGALLALHVVMLAWVAAKVRAECGLPSAGFNHPLGLAGGYAAPVEVMSLVPLLGGMAVFGPSSLMTMTLVTAVILPYGFFLVPGLSLEALEVGRRFGVKSGEVAAMVLLGVVFAVVIGGWVYLTAIYGFGALNVANADDFRDKIGAFRVFNAEYAAAQSALDSGVETSTVTSGQLWGLGFGAIAATAVTVLRQLFPGFWFHPVGVLVGPSSMMQTLWGSLLAAYVVRLVVLRLGGAATVREKLVPMAIGIFLGALAAHALYIGGNAYWFFFGKGAVKFKGLL